MAFFTDGSVTVEAMQFTEQTKNQVFNWVRCNCYADFIDGVPALKIETPQGDLTATFGDWIVHPKKGEFYPCKADIFAETYKPAS